MALVATLAGDRALGKRLADALVPTHDVAAASSWRGLDRLVRERPVTVAVVDLRAAPDPSSHNPLRPLQARYPNLGLVLLADEWCDPLTLFRLGRAGISNLLLLHTDELSRSLPGAVANAAQRCAGSIVVRALVPYLPPHELLTVRQAMEGVHRRLNADDFAESVGYSRAFLSERLKRHGLPSTGHLLVWCRLLTAAHWLVEPGRTAESVSRQLEYSSGAAFRRALKNYTGATPTEVIDRGGLRFALARFVESSETLPRIAASVA